jgi:hypothetical protein
MLPRDAGFHYLTLVGSFAAPRELLLQLYQPFLLTTAHDRRPQPVDDPDPAVADTEALIDMFAPPRRAPVRAREECRRRPVEIPQRLLLYRRRTNRQPLEGLARLGQLPLSGGRTWPWTTGVAPIELLHRQIPHKPRIGTMTFQHDSRLLGSRIRTIPESHNRTLTPRADTNRSATADPNNRIG